MFGFEQVSLIAAVLDHHSQAGADGGKLNGKQKLLRK